MKLGKPMVGRGGIAGSRRLRMCLAAGALALLPAFFSQAAEPEGFQWSDPANWQCGLVPGDTAGADSTTTAEPRFGQQGVAHFRIIVDRGRAVGSLSVGTGYVIGERGGPALHIVGKNARINPTPAGEGPVTFDGPLNLPRGVGMQTSDKTPVVFNGDISAGSGRFHVFNASGVVTFNGSLTSGTYSSNGGDARIFINGINRVGIAQDVTRTTFVLNREGAVTGAPLNAGRGGNYELAVRNALSGAGSINARAVYFRFDMPVFRGEVTIDADNNYTGDTAVTGAARPSDRPDDPEVNAVLRVNNGSKSTGSATGSGDVTIAGAMLAGEGRIANLGKDKGVTLRNHKTRIAEPSTDGVAQGRLSPGAKDGEAGTLVFDLGGKGLDIAEAVAPVGSGALVFDLATADTSDQARLLRGTVLKIGQGNLEFDDFAFGALEGFGPGRYVLFTGAVPLSGTLGANVSGTIDGHRAVLSVANGNKDLVLTVSAAK